MTYRQTSKHKQLWSTRENAKKARLREENPDPTRTDEIDRSIFITIKRPGTGEVARFELLEGNRIDNYSVYCNGKHQGIMGITRVMTGIRKALPSYRRMD